MSKTKEVLALSARPQSFADLIGQRSITKAIIQQMQSGRVPSAWMFIGGTGSGKTSIARLLAVSLQCTHSEFGAPCIDCRIDTGLEITEINASQVNGVEEISKIIEIAQYAPITSKYRVIILDEAQRISSQAQNMLLKPFEDAPRTTVWIICTTDPQKILPTLRSRCMDYAMKPLRIKDINTLVETVVAKEQLSVDVAEFVDKILEQRITSPRVIIKSLEKFASGSTLSQAVLGDDIAVDTLQLCRAVANGDTETLHKHMKAATNEDLPHIIASVCGYMRAIILKTDNPATNACWGIQNLVNATRIDEYVRHAEVTRILHTLTVKFRSKA